ncbi:MAG: hypothetical protein M9894_04740 [Planctomycetes bacterium]|nr:hypothetical protein [Planctomycetota bacterium]
MSPGRLAVGFLAGLVVTGLAAAAVLHPATARAWARARHGGVPGPTGVALVLAPAPDGTAGAGPGPHVVVWYVNAGRAPAPVCWSDPPGEELSFEVTPAGGEALPPVRGPGDATVSAPVRLLRRWLEPGERLGVVCDLSRWVTLPGPGVYEVRAARAPLGDPVGGFDGLRAVSEPARVVLR